MSAPFPKNDPMLPAQDAPHGHCLECESVHRLDNGCPHGEGLPRWLVGILCVALVVCMVALWCMGVER